MNFLGFIHLDVFCEPLRIRDFVASFFSATTPEFRGKKRKIFTKNTLSKQHGKKMYHFHFPGIK